MLKNPEEYVHPGFLKRLFFKRKTAQNIYENFVLSHLKKFPDNKISSGELNNILHINTAVGKGGAAKMAYNVLTESQQQKGLNSKILTAINYGQFSEDIELLESKNIKLHKLLHKYSKKEGFLDFFNLASFNIVNLESFKSADIVHLHNLHGAYFSPFVLPKLTSFKPIIWTLHDEQAFTGHCSYSFSCNKWQTGCGNCPDLNFYPKIKKDTTDFLLQTKKKIYDFSEFTVVCPSKWLADRAEQSILGDKDIRVIYNGINEKIFKPTDKQEARKKLNLPQDKKILLFSASGSIDNPQKGGKYLAEAYNLLKEDENILFVNLGSNKKSVKQNRLDIPYVSEEATMALYYSAADLFIYPSMAETFGLVIGEAMACGTAVVAFNNTAIPETVKHMQTGYLAENRNTRDFVNGIKLFLEDDELRKTAGIKGRERIIEKFTLDKMVENYNNLYKEIYDKFNKSP